MLPLLSAPDEALSLKQLDISLRGSILLAGHCKDPSVLEAANELPLRGMILGSLTPNLLALARKMSYPIIVVNGFGLRPMDNASYKLLTTNAKREVTINAEPFNWQTGARPEILISMPVTQEPPTPRDLETFAPNQTVRLTRNPFCGATGTLIRLLPGLTAIPSGLRVAVAEVKLDSGEQAFVPLANLEVLV
jgi:hypothetical protein